MMNSSSARKAWVPLSKHDRSEVEEELERILASPLFGNSKRYPSLLRYVVERTLSGEMDRLKERTLGIEVFHRAADYDTNADPVVRFSASEVRRRLAQFYQERTNHRQIEIGLPVGTYVPQFTRLDSPSEQAIVWHTEKAIGDDSAEQAIQNELVSAVNAAPPKAASNPVQSSSRKSFWLGLMVGMAVVVALALATAISVGVATKGSFFSAEMRQDTKGPIQELWSPLLSSPDGVVISVGRTRVENPDRPESPTATIEQHIGRPDARISLAAVQAVSQVAGFLQSQHKQFMIHEAYSVALQDLHRRPVTLVSGYNNVWTMRLLKPLRFHFEQDGSLHYISDAMHPDRRDWSVNFDMPYLHQTVDYAIIGRFYDPTTDGPVAVVAGISSNGSQAAGEFIVSPDALSTLARTAPHGSLSENFEAVLKVEVINGNTGAVTVVATQFW